MLKTAKSTRYNIRRIFDDKWKKHSICFTAHNKDKTKISKSFEKFKSTVSEALSNSLHNLPVVSGLSVFVIETSDVFGMDNERMMRNLKQNLVLATCAQSCCQDSIFFMVKPTGEQDFVVIPLTVRKNDDLLGKVMRNHDVINDRIIIM